MPYRLWKGITRLCLGFGLGLCPALASAQTLDNVEVTRENGFAVIEANFATPVQYVRHFPLKSGETLQIYLRVAEIDGTTPKPDAAGPVERKSIRPPRMDGVPLGDVTYEEGGVEGPRLIVRFGWPVSYTVKPARDKRSIQIIVPIKGKPLPPKVEPRPAPKPTAKASPGIEREAAQLMDAGRKALTARKNIDAIQIFTRVLKLPANTLSADALELLGLARERNKQIDLAKVEYKLYLKLYPQGEGAERVRQRLALLAGEEPPELKPAKRKARSETLYYGTLAQNYFRGVTETRSKTTTGTIVDEATFKDTDQSALVSHLDLIGRHRSDGWDSRVVFSGDHIREFLDDDNRSRVSSAYADLKNLPHQYGGRFGRQSGNARGVLGRFDGALVGWNFLPKWRANLVAGEPVDTIAPDSDREFYGIDLALGPFAQAWTGSLYYIAQDVDGITDREAVGTELRYFDPARSAFTLLDYDTYFEKLNIALFQGTWQLPGRTTFNLLADARKSPPLQTTNALQSDTSTSVAQLLQTLSEEQVRELALSRTANSRVFAFGVAQALDTRYQVSGDVTLTNISDSAIAQGTGDIWTHALQLIGSGVLFTDDVSVFGASYTDARDFTGIALYMVNRIPYRRRWRFDFSVRLYQQDNTVGTELERITPIIRVDYRPIKAITLELEAGMEYSWLSGLDRDEESTRDFFMAGYRWDF